MNKYINYILIVCFVAIIYTLLINFLQKPIVLAILSFIILTILAYLLNFEHFAKKYKQIEGICAFFVLIIFAYALYYLFR